MKPAPFDYVRADSAEEAAALLARHGEDARILAGGQTLLAVLNMRLAQPSLLVDISRSGALADVVVEDSTLRVGAAATQSSVEARAQLAQEVPLLALALPHVAHVPIRNRGTVCGSIAHADPAAELPLVLLALGGTVVLRSQRAVREVAADRFFTGMLGTVRAPDELIEAVRFPLALSGSGHGFAEVAMRHGDFALCAIAAVCRPDSLRIAVGGVADRPVARDFAALEGSALEDALNEFAWALDAGDDAHVSAVTRRHLVRRLGLRAVASARADCRSEERAVQRQSRVPAAARSSLLQTSARPHTSAPPHALSRDDRQQVSIELDGRVRSAPAAPRLLLTDFLRDTLGATGTHVGCEHGVCGACTVRIDGIAERACLTLAVQCDGRRIDTVEGLANADGSLSELQAAFRRHHALQCGFCTAGILMTCTHWLERRRESGADETPPSEVEVRELLGAHLCRCTGYAPIVAAVLEVAAAGNKGQTA